MNAKTIFLVILMTTTGLVGSAQALDIVVTSTRDFAETDSATGNEDNYTCGFTSGAFFRPAPTGGCTLRRAVLEAGVRPDSDRPINIVFDLSDSDPNFNAAQGFWEVQIDSSFEWGLNRRNIFDDGGQVTINGATQPIGRNDGPRIMINTNSDNNPLGGRSLEIRTSNNTFRNLGFIGGGQIILYEGGNTVENVWMGLKGDGTGLSLASDASAQSRRSMARGGISMPNEDSDNNIIRNNVIIGAFERAISVTSGGDNNQIIDNWIGTNADGVVPIDGNVDCTTGLDYDPSLWYGGRGIRVSGTNTIVQGNTIAGLNATQSTNDTRPIAMEISGVNNLVVENKIGVDESGAEVGVCGQGMLLQGTEGVVTDNHIFFSRNGFEPTDVGTDFDSAIIMQSFTGQGSDDPDRWMQVWNNIIDGGDFDESNFHAYRYIGPGVPIEMRQFIPARITSIEGFTVTGTNGDPLPDGPTTFCPNCTIYLYLDDNDDRIESLELLGIATADAGGNWTATISRLLSATDGIRTQSESNAADVMHIYAARTTTRLSDDLYLDPTPELLFQDDFE